MTVATSVLELLIVVMVPQKFRPMLFCMRVRAPVLDHVAGIEVVVSRRRRRDSADIGWGTAARRRPRDDLMLVRKAFHAEAVLKLQACVVIKAVATRRLQARVEDDSGIAEDLSDRVRRRALEGNVVSDKAVDVDAIPAQDARTGLQSGNRNVGHVAQRSSSDWTQSRSLLFWCRWSSPLSRKSRRRVRSEHRPGW